MPSFDLLENYLTPTGESNNEEIVMPLLPELRLLIETDAHPGSWNMAVDEALLETAIASNVATLRWYQWATPTLSLGYFQKFSELSSDPVLSQLPVVRRLSGGGAIVHDDEWTYCLALPATQSLFTQPHELYDIVHRAVTDGLRQLGFPATFRGSTLRRPDEPLLCFQRQDEHDLTLQGKKILGSAQRRRRGAIMQHGSLIRRASPLAPHLSGMADLCDQPIPPDLAEKLALVVSNAVARSWFFGQLTESELQFVQLKSPPNDSLVRSR